MKLIEEAILLDETLVISDLHIGCATALQDKNDIFRRIDAQITLCQPRRVILNGDILHEYSGVDAAVDAQLERLFARIEQTCELILIRGNHDIHLSRTRAVRTRTVHDEYVQNDTLILHGHQVPQTPLDAVRRILIGHVHPAIQLSDGIRVEKIKCFLRAHYKFAELWILPSYRRDTLGSELSNTPLLEDTSQAEVFIYFSGKPHYFGFLGQLQKMREHL